MIDRFRIFFKVLIINIFILFFLIEVFAYLLVTSIKQITTRPSYTTQVGTHYGDYNKIFGSWHIPNSDFTHKKSCFKANYSFNSVGSRDIERLKKSTNNRAIVLGDSLVEGYGLNDGERISNILENRTKIPHLNFGTSGHFGSTQYYLNYKYLSSEYSHNKVLVFFTITNDFEDDSFEFGKKTHKKRYRPYRIKEGKQYKIIYYDIDYLKENFTLKDFFKNSFYNFTYTYHVIRYYYSVQKTKKIKKARKEKFNQNNVYSSSVLYSKNTESLDLMKFNLSQIKDLAKTRNARVYLIPVGHQSEFNEYFNNEQKYPLLFKNLKKFSEEKDIFFIDAFTNIKIKKKNINKHFFNCDSHHNSFGNKVIADYLLSRIYGKN